MTFAPPSPNATRVYFDPSDEDADGCGWNVVTGDESIAARYERFSTAAHAFYLWG